MNSENQLYEVVPIGEKFQVVLMADELYRDQPGNLKRRRVIQRKYEIFDSPLQAVATAERWNIEDGYNEARKGGE